MTSGESFDNLMGRLRAGGDDAAAQVFQRFSARLVALARSRLERALQPKVDPEDVLQSVFKSFFVRHAAGEFELRGWDSLWTILTVIAVRKCANQAQHYRRARRSVLREVGPTVPSGDESFTVESLSREPSPGEAAELTDTVEQVMRQLDERDREVFALSLQGETVPAISRRVGFSERTVHRALRHVRTLLNDLHERAERGA
jgi:RNA polymerase sigma-70 factor (ECF subfamily)